MSYTLPWPMTEEEGYQWYTRAISSPQRPESERLFLKRLYDMGIKPTRIFEINLSKKREERKKLGVR